MTISEFKSEDYLKLKWHIAFMLVCLCIIFAAYFSILKLSEDATQDLRVARDELNTAQTALDQIEQQEATIIEYISRYEGIEKTGVVKTKRDQDILNLVENVIAIRSVFNLFPIDMRPEHLSDFILPYDTSIYAPGGPVTLETTSINIKLPLLHEDDLANFIDSFLSSSEMRLPISCTLRNGDANNTYLRLGQHMDAECAFLWYTFSVKDANGVQL